MFAIVSWILSCKNRWMYVQANEFLARKGANSCEFTQGKLCESVTR